MTDDKVKELIKFRFGVGTNEPLRLLVNRALPLIRQHLKADFMNEACKAKLSADEVESLKSLMEHYPYFGKSWSNQQIKWLDEWSEKHPNGQPQPSEQWQALKAEFASLCEEQDRLYKPDFENVFSALFEIDSEQENIYNTNWCDMAEALPSKADKDTLQMALTKTGFANDKNFCKAFIGYCNATLQGKNVQRQMAALNLSEVMSQHPQQRGDGWQFASISIIAPQAMHNVINAQMQDDAMEGKGLFENVTTTPVEDESEDECLMIEVYNCKASLVPFLDDIKRFGIIGKDNPLLKDTFKRLLLETVKACAIYAKEHTDTPAKTKNYVTQTLKEFDNIPVWGLLFQILTLQGLCRWIESVHINEGDNGFNEAQSFYNWLCEALIRKVVCFCYTPYGDGDKERLQPLCSYLYSTEIGKMVQEHLFGKPQPEATTQEPEPSDKEQREKPEEHRQEPAKTIKNDLPDSLNTRKAQELLQRLIEKGICSKDYQWKKSKSLLAYFGERATEFLEIGVGQYDGKIKVAWKPFETLFGVNGLAQARNDYKKVGTLPAGSVVIDSLFE